MKARLRDNTLCKEWHEFKEKWDNNIPDMKSPMWSEYVADERKLHKALESLPFSDVLLY